MNEIIDHVPTPYELSQQGSVSPEVHRQQEFKIKPSDYIKLGEDELAICGVLDLADRRIVILDVGHKQGPNGKYGQYDIDGSGSKIMTENRYVLVTRSKQEDGTNKTLSLGLDAGDPPLIIGRYTDAGKNLGITDTDVSRKHASIAIDEKGIINIVDLNSTNGTRVMGAKLAAIAPTSRFDYTHNFDDFKASNTENSPGTHNNRHTIFRDTEINGGVGVVVGSEAVVVDDKKYPKELIETYKSLLRRINTIDAGTVALSGFGGVYSQKFEMPLEGSNDERILKNVYSVVQDTLKYDLEKMNSIRELFDQGILGKDIQINYFIKEGFGVCSTQALLCGYLIEKLIHDGMLQGRVSIDRNTDIVYEGGRGGHQWARYQVGDKVYIIDPAQKFVGTLEDALKREGSWDYRRTEDILRQLLNSKLSD